MTTTTAPTTDPSPTFTAADDPVVEAPSTPHGPFGRVVAGSLAIGLVAAAVPSLVVFAGAEEHVVTGTGLLGFGVGWLALARLSNRFTNRPQRWALVPAAAMAATGLGLVAFSPGDGALTAAGWIWPPLLLVLAVWVFTQVRRSVPGRARWLLYPVALVLTVAALGGAFETVALAKDRDVAAPGRLVDIGGRRLHLRCVGTGSPTVVFESGLGETGALWERFVTSTELASTRRCSYDRAGQGWSDDAPSPADSQDVAADLHALLQAAHEDGPFVLAGHSAGGPYLMTYAAAHPSDVAGLVLLDASSPRQFEEIPTFPGVYRMARSVYGLMPAVARTGLFRMMPASSFSSLDGDAADDVQRFASSPRQMRNARDEHSRYHTAFPQGAALTSFGDKPLVVVTATKGMSGGWMAAQARLASLSSNHRHSTVATDHVGVIDSVDGAAASIAAVRDVVEAVRTGTSLAP
jgi:pimeloyl-ACP methyl ester carboxylesterase